MAIITRLKFKNLSYLECLHGLSPQTSSPPPWFWPAADDHLCNDLLPDSCLIMDGMDEGQLRWGPVTGALFENVCARTCRRQSLAVAMRPSSTTLLSLRVEVRVCALGFVRNRTPLVHPPYCLPTDYHKTWAKYEQIVPPALPTSHGHVNCVT